MNMNIKENYINILKLAYRSFKIKIINPNNFHYNNDLFHAHIDNEIFILRYKILMPANYIKDKFITSDVNTNLNRCNLVIELKPEYYSETEAEYTSNNDIIEEYGRMIVDFANDQKKENFQYIEDIEDNISSIEKLINNISLYDDKTTISKIINNINLYNDDKLNIINDMIKSQYNDLYCTLQILDSKWRTFDQHLNKYCRDFRERVLKDDLLSLKPIYNNNLYNDIYDHECFHLGAVARFQGGMDITLLYKASHFYIFRNISFDNSKLRGINDYYTSNYDNTFFHNYVLFTEILKKYEIRFKFTCNNKILHESPSSICNYMEDLYYNSFLLYD